MFVKLRKIFARNHIYLCIPFGIQRFKLSKKDNLLFVELGEIFARMRVLIRRAQGKADNQIMVGNLSLDTAHKRVLMDAVPVDLTAKEYMLLTTFMLSPEKVMSKTELEDSLYGWGGEVESNAIEFLIHSLRKKIGQNRIKNVRGLGWYISNSKA